MKSSNRRKHASFSASYFWLILSPSKKDSLVISFTIIATFLMKVFHNDWRYLTAAECRQRSSLVNLPLNFSATVIGTQHNHSLSNFCWRQTGHSYVWRSEQCCDKDETMRSIRRAAQPLNGIIQLTRLALYGETWTLTTKIEQGEFRNDFKMAREVSRLLPATALWQCFHTSFVWESLGRRNHN